MKYYLMIFIVSLLLYGCADVSVNYQGQAPVDMAGEKATYGWFDEAIPSNDIRLANPTITKIVRESVDKRLEEMGYKRVAAEKAEYLIAWFGSLEEDVKEIHMTAFYARNGYSSLLGTMPKNVENGKVTKTFSRGTLTLDVLNPANRNVLWRGSATNTILEGDKGNVPRIQRHIDASVAKILEGLPQK